MLILRVIAAQNPSRTQESQALGTLEMSLLGEFKLALNGEPISAVNTPRLQALLTYLVLHRDAPESRQHIAFLFWPDSSEAQAQSNFRNLLLTLRRSFPDFEQFITVTRRSLQWREASPHTLDVAEFARAISEANRSAEAAGYGTGGYDDAPDESPAQPSGGAREPSSRSQQGHLVAALQKAAELYAGDLLPGCYEEWIMAPRERLRQQFLGSLEQLVRVLESMGDLNPAILYAQRLVRHDPLREENYRRLMRLHLANGDRAGVLSAYRDCQAVLKRELGVEPGQATAALLRQAEEQESAIGRQESGTKQPQTSDSRLPTPDSRLPIPSNLPAQTTTFVGREHDVLQLSGMLRRPELRLITLIGTPGTGKTRLATRVAAGFASVAGGAAPLFPDGVFFVPLAAVSDPDMVEPSIAQALDVSEAGGRSLHDNLLAFLAEKRLLLVLDNFEHLIPAAPLVAEFLAKSQGLKVLATSRAVLNLRGEHEYPVATLVVPGRDLPARPDELMQIESVALFIQRAAEVAPGFGLTRDNARPVGEICRRLEGLPLAIELAAARVKVLSPEAILSRLDRRLRLLVGGRADLPARQQALETAIAWSYNLLDDDEKALFRGLSIFAGGCSLQAIEEVLSANTGRGVLEMATSLLNKSLLVRVDAQGSEPRFSMLETLKEYGRERLEDKHEVEAVLRDHATHFASLAEESHSKLAGPEQIAWLQMIEQEHDNMRAALRWACEAGEAETALRLAGSLGRFWEHRGYLSEGRSWLERALGLDGTPSGAARPCALALYSCGILAVRQRDYRRAETLLEESAQLYRELGDKESLSNALNALAVLVADLDYDRAVALHEENLALRRELGDKPGIATTLHNIGYLRMQQGRWDDADAVATEAHARFAEVGNISGQAFSLYVLGMVAAGRENYPVARERLEDALAAFRQMSNNWMSAWALQSLGDVCFSSGDYRRANQAFDEAEELYGVLGDKLGAACALISRGREQFRIESYDRARDLFGQALDLGIELDNSLLVGRCLAGYAGLCGVSGHLRESALLFGVAYDLLLSQSTTLERSAMTLNRDEVRAALNAQDPYTWQSTFTEGTNTPWEEAVQLARDVMRET
jgi:predicted ATPase/DNA-binding SARP family transcriptional activator